MKRFWTTGKRRYINVLLLLLLLSQPLLPHLETNTPETPTVSLQSNETQKLSAVGFLTSMFNCQVQGVSLTMDINCVCYAMPDMSGIRY